MTSALSVSMNRLASNGLTLIPIVLSDQIAVPNDIQGAGKV